MSILNELSLPFSEVIVRSGAVSGVDRDNALVVLERAVAFEAANPEGAKAYFRDSLKNLANDNGWKTVKMLKRISEDHEIAAQNHIRSGKNVPEGVPPLGQVFSALGYVTRDDLEALLCAQAGALVHKMINDAVQGKAPEFEPAKPRDNDHEYLKVAQTLSCAAWGKAHEILAAAPEDRLAAAAALASMKREADKVLIEAANRMEYAASLKGGAQAAGNFQKLAGAIKAELSTRAAA